MDPSFKNTKKKNREKDVPFWIITPTSSQIVDEQIDTCSHSASCICRNSAELLLDIQSQKWLVFIQTEHAPMQIAEKKLPLVMQSNFAAFLVLEMTSA